MDAVKFLKEKNRMTNNCRIRCKNCPLSSDNNEIGIDCGKLESVVPEKYVRIVEEWSKAHPKKTRQSEFLKHYPDAPICKDDGFPYCLPCNLHNEYYARKCECDCDECRKKYWLEEIE